MEEILRVVQEGGTLMWPILGVSVWMWAIILQKALELRSLKAGGLKRPLCERLSLLGSQKRSRYLALRAAELELDKGLRELQALIAIAPLLGLLGTVMGMDKAFWVIAYHGTGNPRALAQGISEALITTVSGLIVAIPGLFFYGLLRKRTEEAKVGVKELVHGALAQEEVR